MSEDKALKDALYRNKHEKDVNDELRIACTEGNHTDIVPLLLKGADVNSSNEFGFTPLIKAAQNNYPVCIQLLLAAGAEVDRAPPGNFPGFMVNQNAEQTPLSHAAKYGHINCVHVLLAAGADVDGGIVSKTWKTIQGR